MAAAALNEDGRKRKVVVTGCLAQRYSHELAKDLPEADLVRQANGPEGRARRRGSRSGRGAWRSGARVSWPRICLKRAW